MKKTLLLWGIAFVLLLFAVYITNQYSISEPEAVKASPVEVHEAASTSTPTEPSLNFMLTDLAGNQVTLDELRGKNVFINFWATWCKWCVKEMPDMENIHQSFNDQDLVVLAIAVGEDLEDVSGYLSDKDYTFTILLDPDKSVTKVYEVKSIPTSIFIDKEGNVSYKRVGAMNEQQMLAAIENMSGS